MFKAKLHMPMILSLLCPGIGQLVQRRWLAGLFYLLVFLALCTWLLAVVAGMMSTNLTAALAFLDREPNKEFATGSKHMMLWLIASTLVVYLAGIIDTYRAFKRQLQRNIRERLLGCNR